MDFLKEVSILDKLELLISDVKELKENSVLNNTTALNDLFEPQVEVFIECNMANNLIISDYMKMFNNQLNEKDYIKKLDLRSKLDLEAFINTCIYDTFEKAFKECIYKLTNTSLKPLDSEV